MSQILRAVLAGQHPSGKNQIQMSAPARHVIHRRPKDSFVDWRLSAYEQLDRQRGAWVKATTPCHITVRYTKGDLLKRDVPGMEDALGHLLEWCPAHSNVRGNTKYKAIVKKACRQSCPLPFVADDVLLDWYEWKPRPLDREQPQLEITIRPYAPEELTP